MALTFNADQYVASIQQQANAFISAIQGYAQSTFTVDNLGYSYTPIDPTFTDNIANVASTQAPSGPSMPSLTASKPTMGTVNSITVPTLEPPPTLMMAEPTLVMPTAPSSTMPAAPGAAPSYNAPSIPTEPTITLPPVPSFANIALPDVPSVTLPTFTSTMPVDDIIIPTTEFVWNEAGYSSELLDALKAKLLGDVRNGGYGIEPADEEGLWERMRERELLAAETNIQEAARQAAARGFMLPPGALNAQIEGARNEALVKASSANRDIALKRADLYVQNRQFALTQSKEVEDLMLRHYGYMAERSLNAAKYMAEWGINIYNARVARYNARVEAARAGAQIYEAQLKAALSHLEVYKSQIEGARLSVDVQKLMADVYRTQLDGVQALVNVYQTRMSAAKVQAEVELAKLSGFKAQVEAYVAQVGAKESEFKMFSAQVNGEMAKVEAFKAAVEAYAAQVNAYRSKAETNKTIVEAQVSAANITLEKYKAELLSYNADLEAYNSKVKAAIEENQTKIKRYEVRVDAEAKAVSSKVQMWATNSSMFSHIAGVASSHILGQANAYIAHANSAIGAASAGLSGMGRALAAAAGAASQITAEITSV